MKKLPKILTIIFLSVFILQMIGLLVIFVMPQETNAIEFTPQVDIGFEGGEIKPTSIGEYIQAVYKYAIGIVGILATVVLMYGGIRWLTSGGSSEKISDAKAWIGAALSGLVLALASFLILSTINPELVKIQSIEPKEIETYINPDDVRIMQPATTTSPTSGCCVYEYEYIDTVNRGLLGTSGEDRTGLTCVITDSAQKCIQRYGDDYIKFERGKACRTQGRTAACINPSSQ